MKLFSIYDKKGQIYGTPFVCRNVEEAKRNLAALAKDPNSMVQKFPEDFSVFELGSFSDKTGKIDALKEVLHLANAPTQ